MGGGKNDLHISPETDLITSIIPSQMASLDNPFDSDAICTNSEIFLHIIIKETD